MKKKTIAVVILILCFATSGIYAQVDTAKAVKKIEKEVFKKSDSGELEKVEEDLYELDLEALLNMEVSTVSKKSQSISEAPAIVSVITEEQIQEYGVNSLSELMTYIPGFTVQDSYWKRNIVTARGLKQTLYNDKMVVLLNGVPTYDAASLEHFLDFIPLASVKRVEIIRGPGSTLYGTNAFAAVINIITKDSDGDKLNVYQKYGSFNTNEIGLNFAQNFGKVDVTFGASYSDNDGYLKEDVIDNGALKGKFGIGGVDTSDIKYKMRNANAFLNISYTDDNIGKISFQAGGMNQRWTKFGPMPRHIFGVNGDIENGAFTFQNKIYANLIWQKQITDKFSVKASAHYDKSDQMADLGAFGWYIYSNAGLLKVVDSLKMNNQKSYYRFGGNVFQEEIQLNYNFNEKLNVIAGFTNETRITTSLADLYGHKDGNMLYGGSTLDEADFKNPIEVKDMGGYLQVDGRFDFGLGYVAGVRATRLGIDEKTYLTPRAGLVYNLNKKIGFKALYGQAFRGAGPQEQYYKVPRLVYGADAINSGLKPEKINTTELAVDIAISTKYKMRINGFMNTVEDIITRRDITAEDLAINPEVAGKLYDNLGKQNISGAEIEFIGYPAEFLSVWANASYKTGNFETTNSAGEDTTLNFIPYMENITANAGVTFKYKGLRVSPNFQYVGEREGYLASDIYYERPIIIDAYTLLNLSVAYNINDNISIELSGRNLLNAEYFYPEEARKEAQGGNVDEAGNPVPVVIPGGPGSAFYGTLRFRF